MNEVMIEYCPVSGLKILQKPEWTDLPVSETYKVSFKLIGSNILLVIPEGESNTVDLDVLYMLRQRVIDEVLVDKKYIELKDFSLVKGMPDKGKRLLQRDYILRDSEGVNCLGYFGFNASFLIKSIYNTGLLFSKVAFPISIVSSYRDAMQRSIKILSDFSLINKRFNFDEYLRKRKWQFESKVTDFKILFRLYNNIVLYSEQEGTFSDRDYDEIKEILDDIYSNYLKNKKYYRILDYSKITGASSRVRRLIINSLLYFTKEYNCFPQNTFVIGANLFVKTAISISSYINRFNITFVDSFKEAQSLIENNDWLSDSSVKSGKAEDVVYAISQSEIEQLTREIGAFSWERENDRSKVQNIAEDNPLKQIYEAFTLINDDLKVLQDENEVLKYKIRLKDKKIQDVATAKDDFIKRMSNEMQSSMNAIIGYADLIVQLAENPKIINYATVVKKQSIAQRDIYSSIIDYVKIESGSIKLYEDVFSLNKILEEIKDEFHNKFEMKNLYFQINIPSHIPECFIADEFRFKQIIRELISNSLKYTLKGGVTIDIYFVEMINNSNFLSIKVIDTGIGISYMYQDEIFEPFKQISLPGIKNYGSGLGLSIVKNLVDLMDGTILVESTINRGSTFVVCFQGINVGDSNMLSGKKTKPDSTNKPNFHNAKVLIVEEKAEQSFVADICNLLKLQVVTTNKIEDVYEKLIDNSVDAIIIDDSFSEVKLIDVIVRIKTMVNYENMKFIIIHDDNALDEFEIGSNSTDIFIKKPINDKKLSDALMKVLPFDSHV